MALTAEQREIRKTGLTGTQIARVVGLSPFGGPMDVYNECLGLTEVAENDAMRWGSELEQKVADWYARSIGLTPLQIKEPACRTKRHAAEPWIVASCDYIINPYPRTDTYLLECKTSAWSRDWGEPGTDEVPEHVLAQCTWQAIVFDVDRVDVCAALGGRPPVIYTLKLDTDFAQLLVEKGRRFWFDHVLKRVPPIMDGSEGARDYLRARYPMHSTEIITPTPELDDYVRDYMVIAETCDGWLKDKEKWRQRICDQIGDKLGIKGSDYVVTWKRTTESQHVDWEAAFRELATVYGLCAEGFRELLRLHGDEDDQRYGALTTDAEVIARHTTRRPGVRRFLLRKGE